MTHKIDRQLEMHSKDVLKEMIGKRLLSVSTDKETLKGDAAWVAQFIFDDDSIYTIQAAIELVDYYGEPEDITILKAEEGPYREVAPSLNSFPVNMIIQGTTYVDYTIHSNNPEIDDSDYLYTFTDAIIMEFEDGTELSIELFSKFSELIDINVGENLINELTPISEYSPEAKKPWKIESSIARFSITAEH